MTLENVFNERRKSRPNVDAVIFAHGGRAEQELDLSVDERGVSVHRIGDCWAPRSLDEAVSEGYDTGRTL